MDRELLRRLEAVRLYSRGQSAKKVSRQLHCDHHDVVIWSRCYQLEGESGLQPHVPATFSCDQKEEILDQYLQKHVSLYDVCARFKLSYTTLKKWVREYRDSLSTSQRVKTENRKGRKEKEVILVKDVIMKREKKGEPKSELERLRVENEYLRAENALLKKVRTLMQNVAYRQGGSGHEPSKH